MISKKSILYILIIAVAVGFSGCKKKPRRPNPLDTVMGSSSDSSGRGESFDSLDDAGTFAPGETALESGQGRDGSGERGIISAMVYFDFDSSSIKASERAKLTQVANYLRDYPSHSLVLEGHCDWRGTPEYNLGLGERRSQSVRQYLETLGVSPGRLETLSKGDLNAMENASAAQMAEDRRVEFLVIRQQRPCKQHFQKAHVNYVGFFMPTCSDKPEGSVQLPPKSGNPETFTVSLHKNRSKYCIPESKWYGNRSLVG